MLFSLALWLFAESLAVSEASTPHLALPFVPGKPIPTYSAEDMAPHLETLRSLYGRHKDIPKQYELEILVALSHFPDLRDTRIKFVLKSRAPISSRPYIGTLFRAKKRRVYRIGISESDRFAGSPALLRNMSFNARIGALGHELAHTAWFEKKSFFQFFAIGFSFISRKWHRQFERQTDQRAIDYGLGWQLRDWAMEIRGGRYRDSPQSWLDRYYYSPEVIDAQMRAAPSYGSAPPPEEGSAR